MITQNSINYYTFAELKERYGWKTTVAKIREQITYAKNRGVIIIEGFKKGVTHFQILEDNISFLEWVVCPSCPELELTKTGIARNTQTKHIYAASPDKDGYLRITINHQKKTIHRLIMETFNPIENSDNLCVDHINGIRTDNSLTNLRWVTAEQNKALRYQNQDMIQQKVAEGIQKLGYDKFTEALTALVDSL